MSYGCAGRRDSRRQTAVVRIEKSIEDNKRDLAGAEFGLKKATTQAEKSKADTDKAEVAGLKAATDSLKKKISSAEQCLSNTRANSGKGTCAMSK